jgi:uncharacterized protein YbbC (DUF1343 family)
MKSFYVIILIAISITLQGQLTVNHSKLVKIQPKDIRTGAERTELYIEKIRNKRIAIVTNQTGVIGNKHIVDSLLSLNVNIKKVMSPEHGFRGNVSAGEHIKSGVDNKTGLPIISLYGDHKKPSQQDLADIDIVIFDIQDVGVRFYTYISTLHYLMEACAEYKVELIILDRPNPNGHYVDGPILKKEFSSFVGMDPIPVVHGMTVGEYGLMLNGEKWLTNGIQCNLMVIPVQKYNHKMLYQLPIAPSPNLPNMSSIYLYPSLCFFEGTTVSIGRGTEKPFQIYGHPNFIKYDYEFTPKSIPDKALKPKLENIKCKGWDLSKFGNDVFPQMSVLSLIWIQDAYEQLGKNPEFFNSFFDKLAGTSELKSQIQAGMSMEEIAKTWENSLKEFKKIRKKYLLYTDFE